MGKTVERRARCTLYIRHWTTWEAQLRSGTPNNKFLDYWKGILWTYAGKHLTKLEQQNLVKRLKQKYSKIFFATPYFMDSSAKWSSFFSDS